jgi:hypothetical protein
MTMAEHVGYMRETRNAYNIFVEEPNGRDHLEVCFLVHLTSFNQLCMIYSISSPGIPIQG